MISRGIQNTKADFWVHLHPKDGSVYWYLVRNMREWLADKQPIETIGKSKDGAKTGAGYLISKNAPFIQPVTVPERMINAFNWADGTDRQTGLIWGEKVIDWMANAGLLRIPYFSATRLSTKQEQLTLGDFGIQFSMPVVQLIEVKTEMVSSANLFIQTKEGGHRVNQVRRGAEIVTRNIEVDALR